MNHKTAALSDRRVRKAIAHAINRQELIDGAMFGYGEPAKVYKPGENWYEAPGAFHGVSANASDSKPAKLMAVFVLDSNETVLVTPSEK